MDSTQHTYFEELGIVLRKVGYTVHPEEDGLLPIEWNDRPLCRIAESGGIRYRQGDLADPDAEQALGKVTDIAGVVKEYTSLLDQATDIKADGLSEGYKLLADFNGAVLAGHPTKYGAEFITWLWNYGRKLVGYGNYYGLGSGPVGYLSAKEDFCVRAGLLERNRLFTSEQLAEVYRCVHDTVEGAYTMAPERQKLLENMMEQIRDAVPNLAELVQRSNEKELEAMTEEQAQDMTQQM